MTDDIEHLKKQRNAYKGQISSLKRTFNNTASVGLCESTLHRLRAVYDRYSETQLKIEVLDPNSIDRNAFEEEYGAFESKILDRVHSLQSSISGADVSTALNSSFSLTTGTSAVEMRLPEIKLPTFSGVDVDWLSFRDSFEEMIHNRKMEPIIKFHYLITHVREGKAYTLIEHLPISAVNYQLAWDTIYKRYNNEIAIQRLHTKALYEIKLVTKDSSSSLQYFITNTVKHYNALKALKVEVSSWDLILVHHLMQKLDNSSRVAVVKASDVKSQVTFDKFIEILRSRVHLLETLGSDDHIHVNSNRQAQRAPHANFKPNNRLSTPKRPSTFVSTQTKCSYCDLNHSITTCPSFLDSKLNGRMRFEFIRSRQLCTNCLTEKHTVRDCRQPPCSKCSLKHHMLLHFGNNCKGDVQGKQQSLVVNSNIDQISDATSISESSCNVEHSSPPLESSVVDHSVCSTTSTELHHTVLGTAVIIIDSLNGTTLVARALLDSGSHLNFITQKTCNMLKIKRRPIYKQIAGIGGETTTIHYKVLLRISSRASKFSDTLELYVIPKITGQLPLKHIDFDRDMIPKNIFLADPHFNRPGQIDILIGADNYQDLFSGKSVRISETVPRLYESVLGYVACGKFEIPVKPLPICGITEEYTHSENETALQSLDSIIKRFWELDSFDQGKALSLEAKMCEQHFKSNTKRLDQGRYLVSLPINDKIHDLGESSENARNQFLSLERRLNRRPEIYKQYIEFMDEYVALSHMSVVNDPNQVTCRYNKVYYIPHHYVIKESSETTKLRVVFNASSKSSSQVSLNDCLLVGPTIQQDLFSIVLRFRKHQIAFSADIAKMYRQIKLNNQDQDLQRIWWRNNPSSPLKCYRLHTVTYGLASAPYLATKCLEQLSIDEQILFPEASKILARDFYVDDVLSGANSLDQAIKLKDDLKALLLKGGFELRKFHSNQAQLRETESPSEITLILGVVWNTETDQLQIPLHNYSLTTKATKRTVLSEICQLFDPLGICSPIIMIAKLFMQTIWASQNLKWDTPLPDKLASEWVRFKTELLNLKQISIPRLLSIPCCAFVELHGFGDASSKGYGCVFYVRSVDFQGACKVILLCSKSRVAPLKKLTIPRLELCAAVLVAQMSKRLQMIMDMQFQSIHLWSDSEITLFRIRSAPEKFSTFVGTRISQIQENSSNLEWRYVPSKENPADHVSRGTWPSEFLQLDNWYCGPSFLWRSKSEWPEHKVFNLDTEMQNLEVRQQKEQVTVGTEDYDLFGHYSSYQKLLNIFAWVRRFIFNSQQKQLKDRQSGVLTVMELTTTLESVIRVVQNKEFSNEIRAITLNGCLTNKCKLSTLSPFIDHKGLLRVGGRLNKADVPYNQRHPILLPTNHTFSRLVVLHNHEHLLHIGPQALLYNIRQTYWIINGRSLCRKVCHSCIRCSRARPKLLQQIMGDLPYSRVSQPPRVFTTVGIDFCGPFYVKPTIRSKSKLKVYICLFICFAVKAVHLEVVTDLTSNAFIACLKRFVARRGVCSNLVSDNATNFIGAKRELKEMKELFLSQNFQSDVIKYCNANYIQWSTIPPRSPHFGGLWEAGIKSAKWHLTRAIGPHNFTVDEFTTLVIQTEACLNSRPITAQSSDPDDYTALSPGHFLIGAPLMSLPEPSLLEIEPNRLSRYQAIQCTLQRFWSRWRNEYLTELQQRLKWNKESENIKIGTLVLLHQDNVPPMFWPIGRVVNVHRGDDGKVRVVSIRSKDSTYKRSITKISPLPIELDQETH